MKKKTLITAILGIGIFTVGVLTLIHFSNDHIECKNVIKYSVGKNGEKISTEKHVCNEKFHF